MQHDRADEFQTLLVACQSKVFAYIYALLPNADDAQDVLQETVLQLWENFDQYDPSKNFSGWANTLARYQVLRFVRDKQRCRMIFSDKLIATLTDRYAVLSRHDDTDLYREALAACEGELKDTERTLLRRCYQDDVEVARIAVDLKRSPQSICNSLKRIRGSLFDCIMRRLAQEGRP